MFIKMHQTGDTIVEVLIAIAVTSAVLGGAFVSTSRSTRLTRTAQERGEALKVAETQIERIKVAAATGFPDIPPGSFCFQQSLGSLTTATPCPYNSGTPYRVTVSQAAASFTILVQWDSLRGGTNEVRIGYRTQ